MELLLPRDLLSALLSEHGPHEMLQFFIMLVASIVAISILMSFRIGEHLWFTIWVAIAALGSFYIAAEELSWGQHVFEWATPDFWHAFNDQGETNLHNTSSWLDQKPRLILEIGVIVGGLIVPALLKYKPGLLPQKFAIIYPPALLAVIATIVLGITIIDKIDEALPDVVIMERASEVDELFLFYFVLLYLVILRQRVKSGFLNRQATPVN
jgi:hypothetical protein